MANAPPLPTEFHRVTLVLDGASLKGSDRQRAHKYYRYLLAIGDLLRQHRGVKMTKEIHLKQRVINARKKKLKGVLTEVRRQVRKEAREKAGKNR
jgi:hypothetical protein